MIPRYCRPAMLRVWSEERRLERGFEVERAVTAEREEQGAIPAGTTARLLRGHALAALDSGVPFRAALDSDSRTRCSPCAIPTASARCAWGGRAAGTSWPARPAPWTWWARSTCATWSRAS